jgi:hypothetical protein
MLQVPERFWCEVAVLRFVDQCLGGRFAAGTSIALSMDIPRMVAAERTRLESALSAGDLSAIIERYPVKKTAALEAIAKKLGLQDRGQYESAVRKLLMDDPDALNFVRLLFGTLAPDMDAV